MFDNYDTKVLFHNSLWWHFVTSAEGALAHGSSWANTAVYAKQLHDYNTVNYTQIEYTDDKD